MNDHPTREAREAGCRIAIVPGLVEHVKPHVGPLCRLGDARHARRLGVSAKTLRPQQHRLGAIHPREVGDQRFQNRELAIERGTRDVQRLDLRQTRRLFDTTWNGRGRCQIGRRG